MRMREAAALPSERDLDGKKTLNETKAPLRLEPMLSISACENTNGGSKDLLSSTSVFCAVREISKRRFPSVTTIITLPSPNTPRAWLAAWRVRARSKAKADQFNDRAFPGATRSNQDIKLA